MTSGKSETMHASGEGRAYPQPALMLRQRPELISRYGYEAQVLTHSLTSATKHFPRLA
jgi:hypothetical protein